MSTISVMSKYILARNKFKPHERVKFLLIAESPPTSGGYFYFKKMKGSDNLFRETMKALELFPDDEPMRRGFDKTTLLKEFQSECFFFVDVSYAPVDKLKKNERKRVIIGQIPRLISDVRELDPEGIVIVKSSIFAPVKEALEEAGLGKKILNSEALPFPSHGHLAGVGPDSADLVRLRLKEQQRKRVAIDERYPLLSDSYDPRKFLESNTITQEFGRQLDNLSLRGTGQGEGNGVRYDRCFHQFRHYFKSQMVNNGAPETVAKILGGWTVSTYDDHFTPEQLLDWYTKAYPQVRVRRNPETTLRDVESILRRDGVELGPKARLEPINILRGQFPVGEGHRGECGEAAEATRGSLKVTGPSTKGIL